MLPLIPKSDRDGAWHGGQRGGVAPQRTEGPQGSLFFMDTGPTPGSVAKTDHTDRVCGRGPQGPERPSSCFQNTYSFSIPQYLWNSLETRRLGNQTAGMTRQVKLIVFLFFFSLKVNHLCVSSKESTGHFPILTPSSFLCHFPPNPTHTHTPTYIGEEQQGWRKGAALFPTHYVNCQGRWKLNHKHRFEEGNISALCKG